MTRYQIYCPKAVYSELRADPGFWKTIAFSHVLGSLRSCVPSAALDRAESSEIVSEPTCRGFLTVAATLHEGLSMANPLGAHFRDLPAYPPFASLVNSRDVVDLDKDVLAPLRNQLAFHFDRSAYDPGEADLPWANLVFEEGWEAAESLAGFPLPGVLGLYVVLGKGRGPSEFLASFERAVAQTYEVAIRFTDLGGVLLHEIFEHFGFPRRPVPEGATRW